jgi:serine/threonine-protein kinase
MFHCIHCRAEIDSKFKACPHCGEPITDFLRNHLEAPLDGKYQILGKLGAGGMGDVYKALHVHLNALRVIKLMRANIANDPGAHDRFLREARLATKIHHPSVATLFDFDALEDGAFYMVWEYIEGINLHELIVEKGALSPRYATRLAIQALHGLDAIHRAGIVHRDISPENLMITRDEEGEEHVKIIDLGIAKQWSEEGESKTKTGMFVGKWKYCSPEHLGMLTPGERIDGRADLYSFGIVMYEMLTGVPPFQADTPHRFVMLHASQPPRSLRSMNPSVTASPELEAAIFKALEKDRGKRYATAREFARALEALLPGLDDTPGAPPPLPVASELTEEPTRISGPIVDPHATTISDVPPSSTIQTVTPGASQDFSQATLSRVEAGGASAAAEASPAAPSSGRRTGWVVGAFLVVVAAIVVAVMLSRKPQPAVTPVTTQVASNPSNATMTVEKPRPAAPAIPMAQGHLGINAFPWANVNSIRNLDNGALVDLPASMVTPAPIDLAPGRYEVTLSNPAFREPITQTIEVHANQDAVVTARFADPAQSVLPRFEGQP